MQRAEISAVEVQGRAIGDRDAPGAQCRRTGCPDGSATDLNDGTQGRIVARNCHSPGAVRLRLALKFSREEQILDQMRETHKLLKDAQIGKAETEVRELVAKLEHLRNLLLAILVSLFVCWICEMAYITILL